MRCAVWQRAARIAEDRAQDRSTPALVLFNSFTFVGFFVAVYAAYLLLRRWHRAQNLLLLLASYFFYGCWDWRFLTLIWVSTAVDFTAAQRIRASEDPRVRLRWLLLSVATNLSLLGFFKYFNFFASSTVDLLGGLGLAADFTTLEIVLPVGISFYTFQTMGYTIDVYRGRLQPTRDPLDFALFVAFFPQLVAGPIERAGSLLPQIQRRRTVTSSAVDSGLFLILWGFFKKIVVADNLAKLVNPIFAGQVEYAGADLTVAVFAFSMQIYCDFSGYSDIARGVSRLMGFELMVNFKLPYFAVHPREFWRRWHVSLSSWLRDYLYIPLGGSRGGPVRTQVNLMITMLLGGLWHGAAWHFVIWGAYHGAVLALASAFDRRIARRATSWPGPLRRGGIALSWALTFAIAQLGWLIFRASSGGQALDMLAKIGLDGSAGTGDRIYELLFFSLPVLLMHVAQQKSGDLLVALRLPPYLRACLYAFLIIGMLVFGVRESMEFIYFQF